MTIFYDGYVVNYNSNPPPPPNARDTALGFVIFGRFLTQFNFFVCVNILVLRNVILLFLVDFKAYAIFVWLLWQWQQNIFLTFWLLSQFATRFGLDDLFHFKSLNDHWPLVKTVQRHEQRLVFVPFARVWYSDDIVFFIEHRSADIRLLVYHSFPLVDRPYYDLLV